MKQHKTYQGLITKSSDLRPNQLYVFGSNTEGRHGKGSALIALQEFGAKYGQASGMQGRSYAIITKDLRKKVHPSISPDIIKKQIQHLYNIAADSEYEYVVSYTANATNLNNYSPKEMAAMYAAFSIPLNFVFEEKFYDLIREQMMLKKLKKDSILINNYSGLPATVISINEAEGFAVVKLCCGQEAEYDLYSFDGLWSIME